jgi:Amt family ammonium transporter
LLKSAGGVFRLRPVILFIPELNHMCRRAITLLLLFAGLAVSAHALAVAPHIGPSPPATQEEVAALTQAIHDAQTSGDNAWVLVSAALVLMMTAPGLVLFYGGLVRRKNILGTMMQSFAMMGLITVLWAVVGYSLAFGAGNGFIGGWEHTFLRDVGLSPNPNYGGTIRAELHDLSAYVRHHHPGPDHRRLRRAR